MDPAIHLTPCSGDSAGLLCFRFTCVSPVSRHSSASPWSSRGSSELKRLLWTQPVGPTELCGFPEEYPCGQLWHCHQRSHTCHLHLCVLSTWNTQIQSVPCSTKCLAIIARLCDGSSLAQSHTPSPNLLLSTSPARLSPDCPLPCGL